jgi:hypothetical protein
MKIPPKFDGEYKDTVFIVDHESKAFQIGIEPNGNDSFDLTIASLDKDNKRTEYILTTTDTHLKVLAGLIQNSLKDFMKSK